MRNAGRRAATNVSVVLDEVQGAPGVERVQGMALAWSDNQFTNPHAEREPKEIAPGDALKVDLAHLNVAVQRELILDVRPQPTDGRNRVGKSDMRIAIRTTSREIGRPKRYALSLAYDGASWSGWQTPAKDHIEIGPLVPA